MFDGIQRRVASLWFPRLASDRAVRLHPVDGPFVLTLREKNANRIHCLNAEAARLGLHRGMAFSDARAFCPDLRSREARPQEDLRFLQGLRRWALRYCPWIGLEGTDGLVLDVTGSAHLFGGEAALVDEMRRRLDRAGIAVRIGLADTRGGAWALAHHGEGIAPGGGTLDAIGALPVEALRLEPRTVVALQRLGLRRISDLAGTPRAPLTRRFGPGVLLRLDQATGAQPEEISPLAEPPHYAVRLTLPEPIGLVADVMEGTRRLLEPLCHKLAAQEVGARILCLTLDRVDHDSQQITLRLARALRDPERILPLFERGVRDVDAGFGIERLRLEATQVEAVPATQMTHVAAGNKDKLDDLISRLGIRIGLENIRRVLPVDSHIPERRFTLSPAAYSEPASAWSVPRPRPMLLFPPEPIGGSGPNPPERFRWRRMSLTTGRAIGPERISPEWWREDTAWRAGVRDYWRVETRQGRRLWLFYTPQAPGWFVQGEFA